MEKIPTEITACILDCIIMPQGEILCKGKTVGLFKDFKEFLTKKESFYINCDVCECLLTEQSALLFEPTNKPKLFKKTHICIKCNAKKSLLNLIKEANK